MIRYMIFRFFTGPDGREKEPVDRRPNSWGGKNGTKWFSDQGSKSRKISYRAFVHDFVCSQINRTEKLNRPRKLPF